jgi:acyl-CoA synthetase (AMP-forming)/AMP-acid ligase II
MERTHSLVELLRTRAATEGRRELYQFLGPGNDTTTLSYDGLHTQASAIARYLHDVVGLRCGDRALLLYPPGLDFVSSFFACLACGVIAVPLGLPRPRRPLERLEGIAVNCRPAAVLTVKAAAGALRERLAASPVLSNVPIATTDEVSSLPHGVRAPDVEIDSGALAFLQYTSGTTGRAKGVMVTHGNVLHNQHALLDAFGHPLGSTIAGWLPTFHDMGLVGNLLHPLYIGGRAVLMAPASFLQQPMRWLRTITQHRARISGAPNFAYDLCVAKQRDVADLDLSCWQVAFNGAEPVRAETLDRFAAAFAPAGFDRSAFRPCYGLAENTLMVAASRPSAAPRVSGWDERSLTSARAMPSSAEAARRLVSCGTVAGEQRFRVVDPVGRAPCEEREIGEICVSGGSVTRGYWNDPDRTAAAFGTDADSTPALRTGDRGFIADGDLYVLGRERDVLTMLGAKYCANAIELAAEAAAAPAAGRCVASVVPLEPYSRLLLVCERARGATPPALAAAAARISQAIVQLFELSPVIEFVDPGEIPRTPSGKLRRDVQLWRTVHVPGSLDAARADS